MKQKIEWVSQRLPLSVLKIHPSVQRDFERPHAESIARNWQSLVARPLIVVQMTSGDRGFYIIDGQHTKWAAEKVGEKYLECRVLKAKTKVEMNSIFHLVNSGVRQISPVDSYGMNSRNDVYSSDAKSCKILAECNITVGKRTRASHNIAAVQQVRKAFNSLGVEKFSIAAALYEVIADSGNFLNSEVVTAVAILLKEHGDDHRFVGRLSDLFQEEFGQMHSDATMRCIGSTLASNPHVLVNVILEELGESPRKLRNVA